MKRSKWFSSRKWWIVMAVGSVLGFGPGGLSAQEKNPLPKEYLEETISSVERGKEWLMQKGYYDNYLKIVKSRPKPVGQVYKAGQSGSRMILAQAQAERKLQPLAVQYTAQQIAELQAKGVDVVDSLLRNHNNLVSFIPVVLRHEHVVEGRAIAVQYKERPHGANVSIKFVVSAVYKGNLKVGDTVIAVEFPIAHGIFNRDKEGNYIFEPKHSRLLFGFLKASFPLVIPSRESRLLPALGENEYYPYFTLVTQGDTVVGDVGAAKGKVLGTRDDLRRTVKLFQPKK